MSAEIPMNLGRLRPIPTMALEPLDDAQALEAAKAAFTEARDAQINLTANLYLSKMLFERRLVTYTRLRGMRTEARKQFEQAARVLAAIESAIDAMDRSESAIHDGGNR